MDWKELVWWATPADDNARRADYWRAAAGKVMLIDATSLEDERPRFVRAGKVINRYRPLKPRRIRLVHR